MWQSAASASSTRDQRRSGRDLDLGEPRGAARLSRVSATTANTTWPWNSIVSVGEHRIVAHHRADIVLAGNVGGGQHRDDAGRGAHGVEIERSDPPARDRRAADRDVQRALRLADVVDVDGGAGDMRGAESCAVGTAHDAQRRDRRRERSSCS